MAIVVLCCHHVTKSITYTPTIANTLHLLLVFLWQQSSVTWCRLEPADANNRAVELWGGQQNEHEQLLVQVGVTAIMFHTIQKDVNIEAV